jgi:hypothetical protein
MKLDADDITEDEMDRVVAAARLATSGPWLASYMRSEGVPMSADAVAEHISTLLKLRSDTCVYVNAKTANGGRETVAFVGNGPNSVANATFLAAANPDFVLSLIARCRALHATSEAYRRIIQNAAIANAEVLDREGGATATEAANRLRSLTDAISESAATIRQSVTSGREAGEPDHSCTALPPVGDGTGMKYRVEYQDAVTGEWKVMGWCNDEDGGVLVESARLWPRASGVRVVPNG